MAMSMEKALHTGEITNAKTVLSRKGEEASVNKREASVNKKEKSFQCCC